MATAQLVRLMPTNVYPLNTIPADGSITVEKLASGAALDSLNVDDIDLSKLKEKKFIDFNGLAADARLTASTTTATCTYAQSDANNNPCCKFAITAGGGGERVALLGTASAVLAKNPVMAASCRLAEKAANTARFIGLATTQALTGVTASDFNDINLCGFWCGGTGNWYTRTQTGSGVNGVSTDIVATDTAYHTFAVVGAAASVEFYIDGTLVHTDSTHLPTEALKPIIDVNSTVNGAFDSIFIQRLRFSGDF